MRNMIAAVLLAAAIALPIIQQMGPHTQKPPPCVPCTQKVDYVVRGEPYPLSRTL